MNASSFAFPIHETSAVSVARRAASDWAHERGWSEEMKGRVALVVTELGRNLALHTTHGGTLLLRGLSNDGNAGLEILSLDSGPGMANFSECVRDGFSSIGTAGIGLGAVQRVSTTFAVHSQTGIGTALLSEIWPRPPKPGSERWQCSGVSVAAPYETVCGDSWAQSLPTPGSVRIVVADGLGHGQLAAQASLQALEVAAKHPNLDAATLLDVMNGSLRATRGAAVAVADLDFRAEKLTYAGIGNISGVILQDAKTGSLISMNGTVGAQCRNFRAFSYAFPKSATLIMASDGLKSHWQLERYVGLADRHPGIMAGVLYRDYLRGKDDATVVVLKGRL